MIRKLLALLITLAIMVGTYGVMVTVINHVDAGAPTAKHGQLDLTHWNFAKRGTVRLSGDWAFYPNQLLNPKIPATNTKLKTAATIAVPDSWTHKMPAFGVATYRLELKVSNTHAIYGLKMQSLQMASRIYLNGVEIGSSGTPAKSAAYVGKNKPFVTFFKMRPGFNDIVVQVANYDLPSGGGMNQPLYLGYADQITSLQDKAMAYDFITITLCVVMGLYFVGLYRQRRKDYSVLFFGLLCLIMGGYSAFSGEKIIYDMIPWTIPDWIILHVQVLSAIGGSLVTLLYVYFAFRQYCSKRLIRLFLICEALLAIGELTLFHNTWTTIGAGIISLYVLITLCYSTSVLVLAALAKEEGGLYTLLAAVGLCFYTMSSNMSIYFGIPVYTIPPIGSFLLVLMFALLISLRFTNAFKQNELMSAQLIQTDRIKDEFLSKTAHEFKTPLHGMISIAESMLDDNAAPLTDVQQGNVGLLSTMAKRLSHLVYDILDFTNLQQGELKVALAPVDVCASVDAILKIYSFIAREHVQLVNLVPKNLPTALADEDRFRQILGNLLDNALKHTDSGVIQITAIEKQDMVEISVVDSGAGIDEKDLAIIFEPFTSLNKNTDESFGLGLSIVKQLVELQQGRVWVASTKGQGSQFTFSLPIADPERNSEYRAAKREKNWVNTTAFPDYSFVTPYVSPHKGSDTILAVDDRFSNLKILIDALEKLDYTVVAVKSGEEALWYLENQGEIDLVILDLMMPGISGFDVCQAIRTKYSLLELPVVMVTASIQPEDKIAAFASGANDYLPKPFDMAELRARINSLLVMKESAKKATNMEVAFLQSQIKPHFLFNVLNTIMALSYTNTEQSRKLTADLSQYLRGSFSFGNVQSKVRFNHEFSLIQSYVEIEKIRFKDRIHVEYEISPDAFDVMIPPLLIQPLVENAIRHGITNRMEGGTVYIRGYQQAEYILFEIEDNGVGMTKKRLDEVLTSAFSETSRHGVGLQNINRRLKYLYNTELHIESSPDTGTKVTFKILP